MRANRIPGRYTVDVAVLALVKGTERYVFIYDHSHRIETIRTAARYASNPELSFTWHDAAVLSQRIREDAAEAAGGKAE